MLIVISPAKSLNEAPVDVRPSEPVFADEALRLARTARNLTLKDLRSLMSISEDLARLNRDRFRDFSAEPGPDEIKPAALMFAGDTYQGLEAATLAEGDMAYAQEHLRILSGLYGLLRPLDGIQPYRLEMGSRLKTRRGKSLYDFWGDRIAKALNQQAEDMGTDILLNCASQEYFGATDHKALKLRVITPAFYEDKGGKRQMVSFYAKQARGAMARFAVETRATEPADLEGFETGGYRFDPEASEDGKPVFVRPYPEG
ncbi:peroxide stress protein YaaA [Roseisalinus antarcticus]|uniref:UPF0246 protein ROA7023_01200 n=1 Tax=Roseisalinus antarcticus TaxID=254357 RepID=A0A1Y5S631_9RHOB|nr:peroxide stress protein YaaA [Roseisalinus antarcticus]SLN33400.1 hypothetical protein ROA7023_01200 [Roseisalinus antarcticus]